MRALRTFMVAVILATGCSSETARRPVSHPVTASWPTTAGHFFDPTGAPVVRFEPAWTKLEAFFGDALPARVTVDYKEQTGQSHFDPRTNTIHLVVASYHGEPELSVVAHETSHLALAILTAGASTEDSFRFLDEGLATVMQYEVQGLAAQRRQAFRRDASTHLKTGRATLEAMQSWSTYFGDPAVKADYSAYEDAAAFVFFLSDTYGRATLRSLFVDLGKTHALAVSVSTVLGPSEDDLERLWGSHLQATDAGHTHAGSWAP